LAIEYTNSIIFIAFAYSRIIDIVTYQMRTILIPRIKLKGYRRSMILAGVNYLEIIFWFASIYLILGHIGLLTVNGPKAISVLRESIGLMVSSDSNVLVIKQSDVFPWIALTLHSFVGLFMTTVVAARIIAILPRPSTSDSEERIRFRANGWKKKVELHRAKATRI